MGPESSTETNPRRVALCVAQWSHQTTVLAWAWLRQYFLRKDLDEIVIVHTGKNESWDMAGPLCANLETCLQGWNYSVVSLHGSLQSNIREFLERYDISLVLVGDDFPRQGGFRVTSASEWVKTHVSRPFIIVRQDSVVSGQLRISSQDQPMSPTRRISMGAQLSPDDAPRRKIAIAYSSSEVGYHMVELAKRLVLLPNDEIFMVHCSASGKKAAAVYKQTKSLLKRVSNIGLPVGSPGDATATSSTLNVQHLGLVAQALNDYDAHLDVVLKGDPKQGVAQFCEEEHIDLLIISSRSAGRLRKTFSGGSVSSYLINKVSCPCLVFPLKCLGFTETEELTRSMTMACTKEDEEGEENDEEDEVSIVSSLRAELQRKNQIIDSLMEEIRQLKESKSP
eukprot:jgi/Picre1/29162/NNA_004555.t1